MRDPSHGFHAFCLAWPSSFCVVCFSASPVRPATMALPLSHAKRLLSTAAVRSSTSFMLNGPSFSAIPTPPVASQSPAPAVSDKPSVRFSFHGRKLPNNLTPLNSPAGRNIFKVRPRQLALKTFWSEGLAPTRMPTFPKSSHVVRLLTDTPLLLTDTPSTPLRPYSALW